MNNNKVIPSTCSRENNPTPLNKIKDTECKSQKNTIFGLKEKYLYNVLYHQTKHRINVYNYVNCTLFNDLLHSITYPLFTFPCYIA